MRLYTHTHTHPFSRVICVYVHRKMRIHVGVFLFFEINASTLRLYKWLNFLDCYFPKQTSTRVYSLLIQNTKRQGKGKRIHILEVALLPIQTKKENCPVWYCIMRWLRLVRDFKEPTTCSQPILIKVNLFRLTVTKSTLNSATHFHTLRHPTVSQST